MCWYFLLGWPNKLKDVLDRSPKTSFFFWGGPNNLESFLGSQSQFGEVSFDGAVNNILGEFFGFVLRHGGIPVGAQAALGHQPTCS